MLWRGCGRWSCGGESGMMDSMKEDLPDLIAALLSPQSYPHSVAQVSMVQTHISWVLLAGDFAYKIKKPLKLAFLDFSTLALRHARCCDELRLNQRFAPDIYLDVIPITAGAAGPQFGGVGAPLEWAVKMRRFDEAGRLDRVCARGELLPAHLSGLAQALVAFHQSADAAPAGSPYGCAELISTQAQDNFTDLLRLCPRAELRTRLLALQHWTQTQAEQLASLMQARQHSGRVRECHGDLHLANLVLVEGQVRMFDCLEFSLELRWIDVASDIAFTYADLMAHGRDGLANWFVNEVWSHSGDYEAAALLRFYAVYRCLVRAKVAAIRVQQTQGDDGDVLAALSLAQRLIAPQRLQLTLTHGLAGSGKTWASNGLLQSDMQAPAIRLRSDVQRKRLFGLDPLANSGSGLASGIYGPQAHSQTYTHLQQQARQLLCAGWSVIVDAAFLQRADRDAFATLAAEMGADFAILAPKATPEQLRQRIMARSAQGSDASEATLAVLAQQLRVLEPLGGDEERLIVL